MYYSKSHTDVTTASHPPPSLPPSLAPFLLLFRILTDPRSNVNQLKQMVYILENDLDTLLVCEGKAQNYNPLYPFICLVVGVLCLIVSLLWILQVREKLFMLAGGCSRRAHTVERLRRMRGAGGRRRRAHTIEGLRRTSGRGVGGGEGRCEV